MQKARIALLMPTYADIAPRVYRSHMIAALQAMKRGYEITQIGITEKELICHARNRLIKGMLDTDCTHALCLDSDVMIPPNTIYELIETNFEMVTGVYFQKEPPYVPLIYAKAGFSRFKKKEKGLHKHIVKWPENTIFPIDACGFGCVLIKREVFERIKSPWFAWTEWSGEDIGFCTRVRLAKIPIFCHSGILCKHLKTQEIGMEEFQQFDLHSKQIEIKADIEEEINGCNVCK